MKISAISQDNNNNQRRNLFIQFSNSFMATPDVETPVEKINKIAKQSIESKSAKLGIENLQEFTIFPKQVVDGKTIITA